MKRAWLHWSALGALGLALVGLVEAGLRLFADLPAAPASTWTLIDPLREEGGRLVLKEPFLGSLRPVSLPLRKEPGTVRVFCFGGSTTYGYPWPAEDSWPASLERRLRALYPDRSVEVVNLGGTSYGSARVLGLMRGALRHEPDLFVAAFGHNEFVEDSYQAAVARPPGAAGRLRSLHLYRALEAALPAVGIVPRPVPVEPGEAAAGFFFTPQIDGTVYMATPARRREVAARLAENVRAMIALSRDAGVPLLLATEPASILGWPPGDDFAAPDDPATRESWQRLRARAEELAGEGNLEGALRACLEAARLWDGSASLSYQTGSLLLALRRRDEALPWLERARDLDPVPVRAVSGFQDTLRSAAAASAVPLVDGARAFLLLATAPEREQELILDNVHLTVLGNRVFARQVWRTMASLPPWDRFAADREAVLTTEEEREALAPRPLGASLAYVWGQIYARKGLTARAEEMYRQAAAAGGGNRKYASLGLAQTLFRQGRRGEARAVLEELARSEPGFTEPSPLLGRLRELDGDRAGAIIAYRRSFDAGNSDRHLAAQLAAALLDEGRRDEAAGVLERAVAAHPGDPRLADLRERARRSTAGAP